jgi:ATP-binding cassette subfamily B protein
VNKLGIYTFFLESIRKFWGMSLLFILSNLMIIGACIVSFCPKRSALKTALMCMAGGSALLIKWCCTTVIVTDTIHRLQCHIFGSLLKQNISFFNTHLPVELAPQITYDLNTFGDLFTDLINRIVLAGILLCTFTTLLIYQTHQFLFLTLLLTPGLFFIKNRLSNKPLVELTHYLHEVFSQLRTIFALNHQNFDLLVFERWSRQIATGKRTKELYDTAVYFAHFVATAIIVASIVLLCIRFMPIYVLPPEQFFDVISSLVGIVFSLSIFTSLQKKWSQFQEMKQNLVSYFEKTALQAPAYRQLREYPAKGLVAIHNVSFAYPNLPDQNVIQDFNFSIYPGETIAIIGASGSGKSTLLNLLMGFYPVSSGNIYLDGVRIQELAPDDLRANMALVDQEPQFFTASIYENILYGNPKATDGQLQDLIDHMVPPQWFDSFPKGLHTIIGPRGLGLSVGQKQMIALLRMLLRNASILLLDEATSGLDYDTENYVMRVLRPVLKSKTAIMVTHKLTQIDLADRIIVMHKGRIVGFGDHHKLFNENLFYRKLISIEIDNMPARAQEL